MKGKEEFKEFQDESFFCYSKNLYHFLSLNNVRYIYTRVNNKSGFKYWLYKKTPELDRVLDKWERYKNMS